MKKINITKMMWSVAASLLMLTPVQAQALEIPAGEKENSFLGVDIKDIQQNDSEVSVYFTADLNKVSVKSSHDIVCTPMLVNQLDTLKFQQIILAGRDRWYYLQRNKEDKGVMFQGYSKHAMLNNLVEDPNVMNLTYDQALSIADFRLSTPYRSWMNGCEFILSTEIRGCAGCLKNNPAGMPIEYYALGQTDYRPTQFMADFIYVTPVAEEVKAREISGRAFVDFPVNKIVIYPDYRNNTYELGKIIATIDSVKNDKDITVNSLHIAGTASPEGPYDNNVYLAKNRTQALKEYVQNLYKFPEGFITTSYEPVDWKGLREWLESSNIENKEAILAIVNSDIEPYARNSKIKKDFPVQYDFLLRQVYPALRHSDYVISFTIRQYTTIDEILEVMQTSPQKLSLAELFRAANSQPEGSELYTEAFEIAVRLYPQDETANLNAGIAAMKRGDYVTAEKYLAKAGNSEEAQYAVAVLNGLEGNTNVAIGLFEPLATGSGRVAEASRKALELLVPKGI